MPEFILHKDGAYQLYTTVADAPCYQHALTLDELTEIFRREGGQAAVGALPDRLERAHKTGCSGIGYTLEDCVAGNRAGPNESEVPFDEFVSRWLTIPVNSDQSTRAST